MKFRIIRWIFIFILSLPLIWFGFAHVNKNGLWFMEEPIRELQGYERVSVRSGSPEKKFLGLHCHQCALISSSGHMLGSGAGEEIDQTECVLRMNNAPTKGFEKDVGSRCDVRVVSHTSVPHLRTNQDYYFKENAGTTYVFWGPEKNMRQDGKGRVFNIIHDLANNYPNVSLFVFTNDKVKFCDDTFEKETGKHRLNSGAYLSTGFFSLILALELCDRINVYGMVDDNYCSRSDRRDVSYHYYGKSSLRECTMYRGHEQAKRAGHRFITEKTIFARWAKDNKIVFKHPSWDP